MNDLSKKIKYIISQNDVDKLRKHLPKKATVVYQDDVDGLLMDYDIVSNLKRKFSMDTKIKCEFTEETFEEWLSNREKPYYVIYKYVAKHVGAEIDIYDVPYDIDFKSDLLISPEKKVLPKNKGVPTLVEYYEIKQIINDEGNVNYSNKICEINFELKYTSLGFIYQKIALLGWCMSDGTCDAINTKDIGQVYDTVLDSGKIIKEGVDRRRSIYDELQLPALAIIQKALPDKSELELMSIGREFMSYYKDEFDGFIYESRTILDTENADFGMKSIVSAVKNDNEANHAWLDTPVDIGFGTITGRAFFMEQMSI